MSSSQTEEVVEDTTEEVSTKGASPDEAEVSSDEVSTEETLADEALADDAPVEEVPVEEVGTSSKSASRGSLWSTFSYLFELDPRSLALFRIVFGVFCVADLWLRLPHLQMMYASSGWMPSHRVLWYASTNGQENANPLSLLYLFNTTPMITAFFFVAIFCAVCFTLGYRTRLFHILTGIFMLSVHNRNDVLHNGGDIVHNIWWMWTIWLPLGRRWSVDALRLSWRRKDPDDAALNRPLQRDTKRIISLAACAILVDLSACYYLNGVHKNSADWLSGNAVPYVLEQDRVLTTFGDLSRIYFPLWALRCLSWSTLIIEASFSLFLLLPVASRRANMVTLFVGAVITHFMFGKTPLTTILALTLIAVICALMSRVKRLPAWSGHLLFTLGVATSVYLLAFPLWLALLVALVYAIPAALMIHYDIADRQTWMRRAGLLALGGFHIGAGASLQLGFFSYWMMAIYFVLLRSEDWALIKRLFTPRAQPIKLFYDSDCGVCRALARLGARLDLYKKVTWVGRTHTPAELPGGLKEAEFHALRDATIIAMLEDDSAKLYTHHRAVAQVLKRLPLLTPLSWFASLLGPLGKLMYNAFAARRHRVSAWLGYGVCGLPSSAGGDTSSDQAKFSEAVVMSEPELSGLERMRARFGVGFRELGLLACIFAFVPILFSSNTHYRKRHELHLPKAVKSSFTSLSKSIDGELKRSYPRFYRNPVKPPYPSWARSFAKYGGFYQAWGLFTHIPRTDGWMIFEAKLRDGRVLDMRTGLPPNYEVADYERRSWGFYEARWGLKLLQRPNLRPLVTDWAKRTHLPRMRLKAGDVVDELNFYWVSDNTLPPVRSGVRPPKFKEKKLIHSWSRKAERLKKRKVKKR